MGKYLNEENYQKSRSKLRFVALTLIILGIIALIASIILIILGFSNMGTSVVNGFSNLESGANHTGIVVGMTKTFGLTSAGFFIGFIGFLLIIIGAFILTIASRREIIAFTAQQTLPVEREMIDEMTPTVANSAEKVAGHIAKGVKKGLKDSEK